MSRKIHMIGNAHIDPVWLWRWQQGYAEIKATFQSALDEAMNSIERQLRKNKTKLGRRIRETAFPKEVATSPSDAEDEPIVRIKEFVFEPMSPEDAILQMNLLGHQFFVYQSDRTGLTNVVYVRKNGGYGIIAPKI